MPTGDFRLLEQMQKLAETPVKPVIWRQGKQKPGEVIDDHIQSYIEELLNRDSTGSSPCELIETDNFAEVVEKLCILHCRMWYLEDQISYATDDAERGKLKSKIDQCFKVKRPKLVEALNKLIEGAVLQGKSLHEQSVKLYKGFDDKEKTSYNESTSLMPTEPFTIATLNKTMSEISKLRGIATKIKLGKNQKEYLKNSFISLPDSSMKNSLIGIPVEWVEDDNYFEVIYT